MEADKMEMSEVYKELRKFTGAQDLEKWAADNSKLRKKEVKALIKKAIQDGQEEALRYDEVKELDRMFITKEITREEYESSQQKKVYEKYTSNIQSKVRGLDIICILQAILPAKTLPTYEQATDAAIDEAEKLIKEIHKTTGCKPETAGFFAGLIIQSITYITHYIYYPKKHASFQKDLIQYNQRLEEVAKKITYPLKDTKNDQFYKEHERITNEMNSMLADYIHSIYNYDKGYRIAEDIVIRLYPKQELGQITTVTTQKDNRLYFTLPSTSLTKLTKQILNNPTRIKTTKRGQIKQNRLLLTGDSTITYKGNDSTVTLTLERTKELFTKKIQNGAKVFNFFLQKLNEQNRYELTKFQLAELVENGTYANKDSAYRGLKNILNKIYAISIEGIATEYNGRKQQEKAFAKSRMISSFNVTYNDCFVSLTPIIRENIPYITLLPNWSYKLNENSYMLLDYIFYLARQNAEEIRRTGYFNIGLETIRAHMGLPTPEEAGSDPKRLIFEPIDNAITEIEEKQKETEIKITPGYYAEYDNIQSYLSGYLKIELDQPTQKYMIERAIAQEKEYKLEQKRIEKAKQKAAESAIKQG